MSSEGFYAVIGIIINAVLVLAAVYVYGALMRQIASRPVEIVDPQGRRFGMPEAIVAAVLTALFLINVYISYKLRIAGREPEPDPVGGATTFLALLFFLVVFLRLRGFDISAMAGFSKLSFGRTASTGIILLLAAYPLVGLADLIIRKFFGADLSRQEIIELFNNASTLRERVIIIVMAVAVAPIVEEFMFRFFLYGVIKRYAGRFIGVLVSAGIFALVHGHLPSLVPLLILGACLTLAYEWSGSILVSMTMHALFNSAALTFLAFPRIFPQ